MVTASQGTGSGSHEAGVEVGVYRAPEAAKRLGVSMPTFLALCRSGRIHTIRAGRRLLIPKAPLERWLAGEEPARSERHPDCAA